MRVISYGVFVGKYCGEIITEEPFLNLTDNRRHHRLSKTKLYLLSKKRSILDTILREDSPDRSYLDDFDFSK